MSARKNERVIKIQVRASFHMRADTRRKVLPKLIELFVGASPLRGRGGGGGVGKTKKNYKGGGGGGGGGGGFG